MKIFLILFTSFYFVSFGYSQCLNDTIPPSISCQNITAQLSNTGTVTITAAQIDNGSFDNCGIQFFLVNGQSNLTFNCSNIGTNQVILSATDSSGNTNSCVSTITVEDIIPPTISCNNINITLSNSGFSVVSPSQIDNASFDNCSIAMLLLNGQTNDTFTCADIGVNQATLTVMDIHGNSSTCSSIITIIDAIRPIPICQNTTVNLSNTGITTIYPNQIDNGSFDNCGISFTRINGVDSFLFNCNNIGQNIVTLSVIDASGNIDTCSSIITITDSSSFCALSTSTINQAESMIQIYPNPASKLLNISSDKEPVQQLRLTNLTGQLILEKYISNPTNNLELDLSRLPNSVYLLTIITENSRFTKKIMVQK
jgi:hypothetical protein